MSELPQDKPDEETFIKDKKSFRLFMVKEAFDKIGFGFGSQQFINILMWQNGASLFMVGIINTLRVVFGNLTILMSYKLRGFIGRRIISISGIVFGFSFLLMAAGMFIKSVVVFALAVVIGGSAAVIYGESRNLVRLKSANAQSIEKLMKYGFLITAACLFISAFIMDLFPSSGTFLSISLLGTPLKLDVLGYLLVFEIVAISFILAGYFLLKAGSSRPIDIKEENIRPDYASFLKNRLLVLLILANITIGIVQAVGFSYYGIYIYSTFNSKLFGGFLNVAMVFLISAFTSLIGYMITKMNTKVYKKFSVLVFGSVMLSLLPFTYFIMDDLAFITMGTILGIIGASAFGISASMIVIDLVSHGQRQAFFNFINLLSIPSILIVAPMLAFVAEGYSMNYLFLALSGIMVILNMMLLISAIILRKSLI